MDVETGRVARQHLLVEGDRIAARLDRPPTGFSGEVVEAEGLWLIPGLRDAHVHSSVTLAPGRVFEPHGSERMTERLVQIGVIGMLDLFSNENRILPLRDAWRSEPDPRRAEIFAAGPCVTAPGGHCTQYPTPARVVEDEASALRTVQELAARELDVLKLVFAHASPGATRPAQPTLSRETFAAALDAARQIGLPSVVHIRSWADVADASRLGATAITHLPGLPMPEGTAELLASHGTRVIPTLTVGDLALVLEPDRLENPLASISASERVLEAYRQFDADADAHQPMRRSLERAQGHRLKSLAELHRAGVRIVAGSDSGNPFTLHGVSLHREIELYVEAGLSPTQALRTATVAFGELLARPIGLDPGDEASFLLIGGSPLDDIRNTQDVRMVIHRGEVVVDRRGRE